MKKKTQANLNFEAIYQHFCKGSKKSGCCAYFISEEGSDQDNEKDKFFKRV
jgi:hypothetical protein